MQTIGAVAGIGAALTTIVLSLIMGFKPLKKTQKGGRSKGMGIIDRIKHAWNAFIGLDPPNDEYTNRYTRYIDCSQIIYLSSR